MKNQQELGLHAFVLLASHADVLQANGFLDPKVINPYLRNWSNALDDLRRSNSSVLGIQTLER